MNHLRRPAAIATLVLLAISAGPAAAAATPAAATPGDATPSAGISGPVQPPSTVDYSPAACSDRAYNLIGGKWKGPLAWRFQSSSTPGNLSSSAVLVVLKRSFDNITGARNDCGLPDTVAATSTYAGTTTAAPSVTGRGRCAAKDGLNVVGFGPLPAGILAVTCVRSNSSGRMTEADIRINSNFTWALSVASCAYWKELLEPTLTHEIGHAFGLAHVSEARHGRLTMSTVSDGPCSNAESTLGLGDIRGLRHLYPL